MRVRGLITQTRRILLYSFALFFIGKKTSFRLGQPFSLHKLLDLTVRQQHLDLDGHNVPLDHLCPTVG